mmetsp:Transcript_18006/g.59130  ORF Transcript_18006/g.59130 Transcript_18006/m.59130 type:complete len:132 (+) Transcript_18006:2958-3353(+)
MQTIGSSQIFSAKIELWPFISQDEKARLLIVSAILRLTHLLLACRTIVVTLKPLIDTVSVKYMVARQSTARCAVAFFEADSTRHVMIASFICRDGQEIYRRKQIDSITPDDEVDHALYQNRAEHEETSCSE